MTTSPTGITNAEAYNPHQGTSANTATHASPHIIGITGGIGSGKSFISRLLTSHFGIPVYDCDTEAKRLTLTSPVIREQLLTLVGPNVYLPDGSLNRALLADFMFTQGHTDEVNQIIHPVVRRHFRQWCDAQATSRPLSTRPTPQPPLSQSPHTHPLLAIESAILVESNFHTLCHDIWLVTAPLELRIRRAMQRDNASREQVLARINAQTTDDERKKHARHIIINDGAGDIINKISEALSL